MNRLEDISTTEELIKKCKANIYQLLHIAMHESDEHIRATFGGEEQLMNLIERYVKLLDHLKNMETWEESNGCVEAV